MLTEQLCELPEIEFFKYKNHPDSLIVPPKIARLLTSEQSSQSQIQTQIQNNNIAIIEKIQASLNKLNETNFENISNELMSLNFTSTTISDLTTLIYERAYREPVMMNNYVQLCRKMHPYYIEDNGKKIYFRAILGAILANGFEEVTSNQPNNKFEKQNNFAKNILCFIGKLYNTKLLPDAIVKDCFIKLYARASMFKLNAVEHLCEFIGTIGKEFCIRDKKNAEMCFSKLEQLLNSPDMASVANKKNKFFLAKLLQTKTTEKWLN